MLIAMPPTLRQGDGVSNQRPAGNGASNRLAAALSGVAVLGCLAGGALIARAPLMSGGRHPALGEVAGMIAVPTIAALVAAWAARRNRPVVLAISTAVVGLFSVVTGFSIGGAFLPAVAALIWATFATIAGGPARQQPSSE